MSSQMLPDPPETRDQTPLEDLFTELRRPSAVSHVEEDELYRSLEDAERRLELQNDRVSLLQSLLLVDENRLGILRNDVRVRRGLTSPIRKLPSEVLSPILSMCCESNHFAEPTWLPAIWMSSVCSRWREIALSSPDIWCSLYIDLGFCAARPKIIMLLQKFLERTGTAHLLLVLVFNRPRSAYSRDELVRAGGVLQSFVSSSSRWSTAHISVETDTSLPTEYRNLFASIENLPLLRNLAVNGPGIRTNSDFPFSIFRNAPHLRHFSLGSPANPPDAFPWDQITNLNLYTPRLSNIHLILRRCPRLEFLHLQFKVELPGGSGDNQLIGHAPPSRLHSLRIETSNRVIPSPSLFRTQRFPELQSLALITHSDGVLEYGTLYSLIERSRCPLTTLRLEGFSMSDTDTIALLRLIPSLTDMKIWEFASADDTRTTSSTAHLFDALNVESMIRKPESLIVPKLRRLSFSIRGATFHADAFLEMLKSRWIPDEAVSGSTGVDCLRSVELGIITASEPSAQVAQLSTLFGPLKDVGMNILVRGWKYA